MMEKHEFKTRWESDEHGGGITWDDIAECAEAWGIAVLPKIKNMRRIRYDVLKAAGTTDAEEFKPEEETSHE